jgi:hypothetical protein
MSIGFRDFYNLRAIRNDHLNHTNGIIVQWNSSEMNTDGIAGTIVNRIQWKRQFGLDTNFGFTTVTLLERFMNIIFGYMASMYQDCPTPHLTTD